MASTLISCFVADIISSDVSPQSGEADVHQAPRLRTEVGRGIPRFSLFGPRPVLSRPPEPPQLEAVRGNMHFVILGAM